jgi:hypothetical protein
VPAGNLGARTQPTNCLSGVRLSWYAGRMRYAIWMQSRKDTPWTLRESGDVRTRGPTLLSFAASRTDATSNVGEGAEDCAAGD